MKSLLIIFIYFTSFTLFTQGLVDGYLKGKGNTDIAISYTSQNSKTFWGGNQLYKIPRNLNVFGLYLAKGILNKTDLILNIPFINKEFQDGAILLKHQVFSKKFKNSHLDFLVAGGISAPLMNYETENALAIGQKAFQILPKSIFQWTFDNGFFIQSQGGYNYSISTVPSSIPFSVKIGLARRKIYVDCWFDYQKGTGTIDYPTTVGSFRSLTVDYQRIGGVVFYSISSRIGAFLNTAYTISGRNTGKALGIGTGLVLKFNKKEKV
jgi:hypothetical protein